MPSRKPWVGGTTELLTQQIMLTRASRNSKMHPTAQNLWTHHSQIAAKACKRVKIRYTPKMKRPKHPPMALPDLHSPKHCPRMKIFEDGVITMLINSSIRTTARFIVFVIDQLARCKNWEWNVILDWPARFYWLVWAMAKLRGLGFNALAWWDSQHDMMAYKKWW